MEVSLWLRIVCQKKRKKHVVEGQCLYRGVHVLVFMFINGLYVHISLFEEFQT